MTLTLDGAPVPAQLITPPKVAPVSFAHFTEPSTASWICLSFVTSTLKNLTFPGYFAASSLFSFISRLEMYAPTSSKLYAVARPRPDELMNGEGSGVNYYSALRQRCASLPAGQDECPIFDLHDLVDNRKGILVVVRRRDGSGSLCQSKSRANPHARFSGRS